jgi:hypothetical protein
MLALFEDDDLQARLRQLLGGDRAAGAAADDDHVGGLIEALVRLHDLELDHAWVALDLLIGLPVVADKRLDAVVRAEEHEDQRLERDERLAALADLRFLAVHDVGIACAPSQQPERPSVPACDGREVEGGQHEVDRAAGPWCAPVQVRIELPGNVHVAGPWLECAAMREDRIGQRRQSRPPGGSQGHAVRLCLRHRH